MVMTRDEVAAIISDAARRIAADDETLGRQLAEYGWALLGAPRTITPRKPSIVEATNLKRSGKWPTMPYEE